MVKKRHWLKGDCHLHTCNSDGQYKPEELYDMGYFMTFLGLKDKDFYSSDYFPLFPWLFLFLVGFYLFHLLQRKGQQKRAGKEFRRIPVLSFLGRHSLLIYMLHQPVLYGVAMVVKLFM